MPSKLAAGFTAALLLAAAAACGSDDSTDVAPGTTLAAITTSDVTTAATETVATTAATETVATTAATETVVTTAATETVATTAATEPVATMATTDAPQRIVSLSPTATEMLFAIDAGAQVIAVDSLSTYPADAEAVVTDLSAFEPNVEAIAGYDPDLVVTSGGPELTAQLGQLDIEVWEGPDAATFDDMYSQIEGLGTITGHEQEAAELVAQIRSDLEELSAQAPDWGADAPAVYHELSADGYSANSSTFIGQVYSMYGLENIADAAEGDHGGYPQLNSETIVEANPDLIFLADTKCCGESPATVAARPGWGAISAVADGQVYAMDDDIASRWGPRVVDYARAVLAALDNYESRTPNIDAGGTTAGTATDPSTPTAPSTLVTTGG